MQAMRKHLVQTSTSMRNSLHMRSLIGAACCVIGFAITGIGSEQTSFNQPSHIARLLDSYCYSCHDTDTAKGDVILDNIGKLKQPERIDLLNQIQEQVFSGEMPPKKKKQPNAAEREALLTWVSSELGRFKASTLEDKLRYYRYANYVNHEKLFSGEVKDNPFTPARRWRINELIYMELVNNVLDLKGKERKDAFYGIVKPFNLPAESGVKYYDTEIIDGGQFLTLLDNAKWIVSKQLRPALLKSGDYKHPEAYLAVLNGPQEMKRKLGKLFPDETWNLKTSQPEFEAVAMAKDKVTDAQVEAAINRQFQLALQRPPTTAELQRYMLFTKDAIKTGGNAKALEKMMVAVLMEPDFLYRSEFGGGTTDESGRVKLTPREASYAIAYALTDQIPDQQLVQAAISGKLTTAEDYRREVERLLNDDNIPKPRLLRFFQDYFGYYNIYNVFKDEERFIGAYNPHRVVSTKYIYRVPGKVSKEADTLVLWILKQDKEVLKQLLTTDHYFVQHNGNNDEMAALAKKTIEEDKKNRAMYQKLKGLSGKALIEAAEKNNIFTNKEGKANGRALGNAVPFWKVLYGEDGQANLDRNPMPKDPEGVEHSVKMYNLNHASWSYPAQQPFKIEHRAGLLTHPAWLVSFSLNAETDPIRRGRWIREKLLAGFIPDVPITVDAKVPEDHERTLRERFAVTEQSDCWHCHQKMNPLGYAFESYDDFGRFRTEEMLEAEENIVKKQKTLVRDHNGIMKYYNEMIYKTKPVNATGLLDGTGDTSLDGEVTNALDLVHRLAKSERVRQSFVRNVFRYFMGRNETYADSKTLIAADRAYVESGGSFKALVVSLLTSDSFIYRKKLKD